MIEKYAIKDIHKRSMMLIALPKIFYFVPVFCLRYWIHDHKTVPLMLLNHTKLTMVLSVYLSHTYSLFKGQFTTYIISDDVRQIGWVNKWQGTNQLRAHSFTVECQVRLSFNCNKLLMTLFVTLSNCANSFYINKCILLIW